jgi:hypothetical protein
MLMINDCFFSYRPELSPHCLCEDAKKSRARKLGLGDRLHIDISEGLAVS